MPSWHKKAHRVAGIESNLELARCSALTLIAEPEKLRSGSALTLHDGTEDF